MAFQRPFLISLKRQDSNLRWGFGIKGGRDYGEPLTVQTVGEESLAEKFGLHEGDEVIQVGRVNVQDLTLGQVHELLARCGNKIEMFVVSCQHFKYTGMTSKVKLKIIGNFPWMVEKTNP